MASPSGEVQPVSTGAHLLDLKFNAFFPPEMDDYAIPGQTKATHILEALKKRDRWLFIMSEGIAFLSSIDLATYMILNHKQITHERASDLRNYSGRNGAIAVRHSTKLRKMFRLLSRPNVAQLVVLLPTMEPSDQLYTWVRNIVNRKTFLPFLTIRANEFEPQLSRSVAEAGVIHSHLLKAHDTALAMKALERLVVEREDFCAVIDKDHQFMGMVTSHFLAHEYLCTGLEGLFMSDLLKMSNDYIKADTALLIGEETTSIKEVLTTMLACKREKFMICEPGTKKIKGVVRLADVYLYLSNIPRSHAAKQNKELKQLQKQNKRYTNLFEDDWQGSVSLERQPLTAFEPDVSAWQVFLHMRNTGFTTCLISKPFRHKQVLSQVGIPYHGLITFHDLVVKLVKHYVGKDSEMSDQKMLSYFKELQVLDVLNYSKLNACIPIPYKDSRVIDVMSLLAKSDVQQIILTMDTIPKSSTTVVVDTLGPKFALEFILTLQKHFPEILLRPATELVTSKTMPTIHEDMTVLEGFEELIAKQLVNIGVVDSQGRLVGNFTTKLFFYICDENGFELDLLKNTIQEFLKSITKRKHVDWQGQTIPPILARVNENVTILHVIQSLLKNGTSISYLVDLDNKPVSQITKQDVFAYFCDTKPNIGIPPKEKVKHAHVKSLKKRFMRSKFEVIEGPQPSLSITQAEGDDFALDLTHASSKDKLLKRRSGSDRDGQRSPRDSGKSPRSRNGDEESSRSRRSSFIEAITPRSPRDSSKKNEPKSPRGSAPREPRSPRGDPPKSPRGDPPKSPRGDPPKSPRGDPPKSPRGDPKSPRECTKSPLAKVQKALAEEDFVSLSESDGERR